MVEQSELKQDSRDALIRVRGYGDFQVRGAPFVAWITACIVGVICLLSSPFLRLVASNADSLVLLVVPSAAGLLAYEWTRERDRRDRPDDLVDAPITVPIEDWLSALLPKLSRENPQRTWPRLAQSLVCQGRAGTTILISHTDDAMPKPIEMSFEPIALDRCGPMAHLELPSLGDARPLSPVQWLGRYGALTARALFLVTQPLHAIMRSVFAGGSWRGFMLEFGKFYIPLAVILLILPPSGGVLRDIQWLVVPRGLVRRDAWRWSSRAHVAHFDRQSSALLVMHLYNEQWGLAVANERESGFVVGTRTEMDFVLRAWMSSVEPPRVEWLSNPS